MPRPKLRKNNVTIRKTKLALKKSIAQKANILNDLVEVFAEFEGKDEPGNERFEINAAQHVV